MRITILATVAMAWALGASSGAMAENALGGGRAQPEWHSSDSFVPRSVLRAQCPNYAVLSSQVYGEEARWRDEFPRIGAEHVAFERARLPRETTHAVAGRLRELAEAIRNNREGLAFAQRRFDATASRHHSTSAEQYRQHQFNEYRGLLKNQIAYMLRQSHSAIDEAIAELDAQRTRGRGPGLSPQGDSAAEKLAKSKRLMRECAHSQYTQQPGQRGW